MTKKLIFLICAILILAIPALADLDKSAKYLTVRIHNAPVNARDAYLSLGPETWVPLRKEADGRWTGEYLLLDGLYDSTARPEVRFLGMHGLDFPAGEGVKVGLTSSAHSLHRLKGLLHPGVEVVVSGDIVKNTLAVEDTDGNLLHPRFEGSAFRLPPIGSGEIAVFRVEKKDGSEVSYAFGRDVDLADLEDSLQE